MSGVANKLRRILQRFVINKQGTLINVIASCIRMAGACNWKSLIQKDPRSRNDARSVATVIATCRGEASHRIRTVKRVIEASPSRICSIQRKPRICNWHDQLRAWDKSDLRIDIGGFDFKFGAFLHKIPNLAKKCLIHSRIQWLVGVSDMPIVKLPLNRLTFLQQFSVFWPKIVGKGRKSRPERVFGDASSGQSLFSNEICKNRVDLQTVFFNTRGHGHLSFDLIHELDQKFPIGNKFGKIILPIKQSALSCTAQSKIAPDPSPSPISYAKQMAFGRQGTSSGEDHASFASLAFGFLVVVCLDN